MYDPDPDYPQLRRALSMSETITKGEWVSGALDTDKHNLKKYAVFKAKEYIGQAVFARESDGQVALLPTEDSGCSPNSNFIAVSANAIRAELAALLAERDRLILTREHDGQHAGGDGGIGGVVG
ncbi:MAG: hypothetical protein SFW64_06740 [Alphaproteobacteria bacterium]|nr:hypothetical protein [Alphaproteobacteria bacterium]